MKVVDLPDDVLRCVLEGCLSPLPRPLAGPIKNDLFQPVSLSHISARFRAVALASSCLWTHISATFPSEMSQTFLDRSKCSPLAITVATALGHRRVQKAFGDCYLSHTCYTPSDAEILEFLHTVAQHCQRWRDLRLDACGGEKSVLIIENLELPNLKRLYLGSLKGIQRLEGLLPSRIHAPDLRVLHLSNIASDLIENLSVSPQNLHAQLDLHVHVLYSSTDMHQLLSNLSKSFPTQSLTFAHHMKHDPFQPLQPPPHNRLYTFGDITHLCLDIWGVSGIAAHSYKYLAMLNTPNLQDLQITFENHENTRILGSPDPFAVFVGVFGRHAQPMKQLKTFSLKYTNADQTEYTGEIDILPHLFKRMPNLLSLHISGDHDDLFKHAFKECGFPFPPLRHITVDFRDLDRKLRRRRTSVRYVAGLLQGLRLRSTWEEFEALTVIGGCKIVNDHLTQFSKKVTAL